MVGKYGGVPIYLKQPHMKASDKQNFEAVKFLYTCISSCLFKADVMVSSKIDLAWRKIICLRKPEVSV